MELRPLIYIRILFPLNVLRIDSQNLTKFCIHINIDKILLRIVTSDFLQNFDRVTALDLHQNFISAQYLENKLIDLYAHQY